jgi:hypothetical protein
VHARFLAEARRRCADFYFPKIQDLGTRIDVMTAPVRRACFLAKRCLQLIIEAVAALRMHSAEEDWGKERWR